jgi:hypothetical protein
VNLRGNEGWRFVFNNFIKRLEEGKVQLPDGPKGEPVEVPIADLGIQYPVVLTSFPIKEETYLPEAVEESADGRMSMSSGYDRRGGDESGMLAAQGAAGTEEPKLWKLRRYDFLIQFCWVPKPRSNRLNELASERGEAPSTAAVDSEAADTGDSS